MSENKKTNQIQPPEEIVLCGASAYNQKFYINENFKNLGHITLHFQYDESEILGGSIYLKEPLTHELHKDSIIAVNQPACRIIIK